MSHTLNVVEDLPHLQIPPELESSSDSESDPVESGPSTTCTPVLPPTPVSQLADSITTVSFPQPKDTTGSPLSGRGHRKKIHPGRFVKGHKRRTLFVTPSKSKRARIPRGAMLEGIRFPAAPAPFMVNVKEGEKLMTKQLLIPTGCQVMNLDILSLVFQMLKCKDPACHGSLRLHKYPYVDGLQSYFVLHCNRCHLIMAKFSSSLHLNETPNEAVTNPQMLHSRPSQVNARALMAVHVTSLSWQDFRLACALMDLPVPHRNLNQRAMQTLTEMSQKVAADTMQLAVSEVQQRADVEESNIAGAVRCHVSYDASWHRRGHFSNQGFGAVIESQSGKVLDYDLLQRVCRKCLAWSDERKSSQPEEYAAFADIHAPECTANFMGSSQAMEGAIAVKLWNRSVNRNELVYNTYIGDGDSSSFRNVIESNPYEGKEGVRKEECLGHVQKRLKEHLKKPSATSPAIAKSKVERVGQLYRLVVVQNRGKTASDINRALLIMLAHLGGNHVNCPKISNSWCRYAKAQADQLMNSMVPLSKPYLNELEIERATEVFTTFASLSLCASLTMGVTQNSNESLHSIVWHNSPKGKYCGQKSLLCSTALAVCSFNEGSLSLAALMRAYGADPSRSTLNLLAERDRARNYKRERAFIESHNRRKRHLVFRSSIAEDSRKRREKTASKYHPGKYGVESELPPSSAVAEAVQSSTKQSQNICAECEREDCPVGRRNLDQWIGCDHCERWFHGPCVGIKKVSLFADSDYFCSFCVES